MNALHVAHDIPGRLRLRLPPGASTDGLTAAISAEPRRHPLHVVGAHP